MVSGVDVVDIGVVGVLAAGVAAVGCGAGPEFVGVELLDPPQAANSPIAPANVAARITVLTGRRILMDTSLGTPWFTQFPVGAPGA